ncbi:transaldolase [Buchnera aphidicola]|uniref:Transaldolase n=1 Tax=Buchnera aphidicola (Sarucallis kahawaluokalani) TaxID=1241878 RepID=A0A4D6Y934_9GAMM|nr:transaldolase [Buchnera aphidicola]QCI25869.1 transaldolase [Buchnera aphidicola (Sarucallis kahawaluokalani)]
MNQLNDLKKFTRIVVDSGDISEISAYKPSDATTNPSLILKTIFIPGYKKLIQDAIHYGKQHGRSEKDKIIYASDKIVVNIGAEILKHIPGRVSSEIDARISFDQFLCIEKAKRIINMYEDLGISRSKVLIKLAATWECIQAARELEKDNINCNLTLLFSFAQAKACAEANVFLISPFVGRIYDWYYENKLIEKYHSSIDPGVLSVKKIYSYYKKHNYKTIIMGASFRNIEQILELSGCDCLTISPVLLEKLQNNSNRVTRKLIPSDRIIKPTSCLTEPNFRWEHNQDRMAVEKLSEGIRQFSLDQEKLEKILYSMF